MVDSLDNSQYDFSTTFPVSQALLSNLQQARDERDNGFVGRDSADILADMDKITSLVENEVARQ